MRPLASLASRALDPDRGLGAAVHPSWRTTEVLRWTAATGPGRDVYPCLPAWRRLLAQLPCQWLRLISPPTGGSTRDQAGG